MVSVAASPCDARLHAHYIGSAFKLRTHLWRLQTRSRFRILSYEAAPRDALRFLRRGTSARNRILWRLADKEAKIKGLPSVSDSTQLSEAIRPVNELHQEGTPNIQGAR